MQPQPLPDVHADTLSDFPGKRFGLDQVGIQQFKVPLLWQRVDGACVPIECTLDCSVSLEGGQRGVHMSRLVEFWSEQSTQPYGLAHIIPTLFHYKTVLHAGYSYLKLKFNYPILQGSLLSRRYGYQYYPVTIDASLDPWGNSRLFLELVFTYSSTCPCSSELAEHARMHKNIYSVPHSQRSQARVRVETDPYQPIFIETLHRLCVDALQTETQVVVKRADEQAFAELNGQNLKFVEDAARLVCLSVSQDSRIVHYDIECTHYESLHNYNASARIAR